MSRSQWYYPVLLVTDVELAELTDVHLQYIVWPQKADMTFVVFAVNEPAHKELQKHRGYCTSDLAVIRQDYKVEMAANVTGNTLDASSKPVIPMAYAGVHSEQSKG